ncbi:MAG: hypothetical protein ABJH52_08055 [Henriciella sp.]
MTLKPIFIAAFASMALPLASGAASAQAAFCNGGYGCQTVQIKNSSSTTVISVNVTQQSTDGACEVDKRHYKENLSDMVGGSVGMVGESFSIGMLTTCKYKVKFNTTKGCKGDKVSHLSPKNFRDGKNGVKLDGACGTLKTRNYNKKNVPGID